MIYVQQEGVVPELANVLPQFHVLNVGTTLRAPGLEHGRNFLLLPARKQNIRVYAEHQRIVISHDPHSVNKVMLGYPGNGVSGDLFIRSCGQ